MPTVRTYDRPTITPTVQPAVSSGHGVSAEQLTIGARQVSAMGDQITKLGTQYGNLQIDLTEQANQLRVDDALNSAKEASIRLKFDPQEGYQSIKGINAFERQSGLSLTDEYSGKLNDQFSSIEGKLSNEAQKIAFRRNADAILGAFRSDITQHEASEFQTYGVSVRDGTIKNRQNEIALNYTDLNKVSEAVLSIQSAVFDQARMLGKSAEWAEAQSREATSKAHTLAIKTALQGNNSAYADVYMKKFANQMSADDILTINSQLTGQLDNELGYTAANQVMLKASPMINTSSGDRAYNILLGTESNNRHFDNDGQVIASSAGARGIAQLLPETAQEAAKIAGVEWNPDLYAQKQTGDAKKDKEASEYNRILGKTYFDKQLRDFDGNLAMTYAAYNAGPTATREALSKSKEAGEPQNWLSYLPKETQNYVSKNMSLFSTGAGRFQKPSLLELQNLVRDEIGVDQPKRLKLALNEVERQYRVFDKAIQQRSDEAKSTAMQQVLRNGGNFSELSSDVRGALDPEDIPSVMDFAQKISRGDDTTNLLLYQRLSSHPDTLKDLTDNQFFALRNELSETDFKHFSNERAKVLGKSVGGDSGDLNNAAISRTLNDRLNSLGIDPTPKDGSTAAERVGSVRRFVNQSIAVEQMNRGKKLSDIEVSSFIDSLLAKDSKVFSDSFFRGINISKVRDIPSSTKEALRSAFRRNGIEDPSDTDLLNAYWRQVNIARKKRAKENG